MIFEIIPVVSTPMSCYTLVAFGLVVAVGTIAISLFEKYTSKEFKRIDENISKEANDIRREVYNMGSRLKEHDKYIETTNGTIKQIQITIAVQESSISDIKEEIHEIKMLIGSINSTLLQMKK